MQGCANDTGKLIGKVAVLRMAFGCADTRPLLTDYKRLGALTTKGFDYAINSITSDTDDSKNLTENLVTGMDISISGDGEYRKKDKASEIGAKKMAKYIFDEIVAGRQPALWVRFDFVGEDSGTYIEGYFVTTAWNGDFPTEVSTFSGEWKVADADTVVFEVNDDTPVASVTVAPATASVAVNGTQQLTPNILPVDASDKTGAWSSSDTSKVTVSQAGLARGIAAGSATITFTSNDGLKTGKSVITVTA
ncbi:Ig-like domain-containing protein [uncultured Cedecea sp.]|uniref:Ig-like domain-containing protein n=1 Tax=uncultured Cedecea sp. TaxID=988762 RepID=UPI0026333E7A|nr:Ig-like domain-containing protein [uncultured Cedecea sp.]